MCIISYSQDSFSYFWFLYIYLDRKFSLLFLVVRNPYKSYSQKVVENVAHITFLVLNTYILNYVKVEYVFLFSQCT